MVYEHLSKCFILKDPSLGFSELFQATTTIAHGDVPRSVALMLGVKRLLVMAKDTGGIRPIAVGEVFFFIYYLLHYLTTLGAVSRTPIFPSI
jgi:hypothetical protein